MVGLFTDRLYALWVVVYSPTTGAGLSMKAALAQLALEQDRPCYVCVQVKPSAYVSGRVVNGRIARAAS